MPNIKTLNQKKAQVDELAQKLKEAQSIVLTDYRGLTVDQDTKLRKALREANVEYKVIKNSIINFATKESDLEGLAEYLTGPTAIAISSTDAVEPSKVIAKFAKEFNNLEIKGGMVEGKIIDVDGVMDLAETPSKEELLGRLMGSLQSSLYGIAAAINAIADKNEQASAEEAEEPQVEAKADAEPEVKEEAKPETQAEGEPEAEA